MAWTQKISDWLSRMAGVGILILLLCLFLGLYFLKYIPDQQQAFNGRAFRELEQIGTGLENKNTAYSKAIGLFLQNKNADNPLLHSFSTPYNFDPESHDTLTTGPVSLEQREKGSAWDLSYPIYRGQRQVTRMYIGLAPQLKPVIATYKDIFQDYIVLRDRHADTSLSVTNLYDSLRNGEIVFNSGYFSIDYLVNIDTLLKGYDGFNLITVHDVTIEGNSCKLFFYPLQLGRERIILAGVITLSDYRQGYKNISFSMVILIGALVLLLFMHLPVLKIFVLGEKERITGLDIRLIIGTYFMAAFLVFFLFSRIFLDHAQNAQNSGHLHELSGRVQRAFTTEIDDICRQLRYYDTSLAIRDSSHWAALRRLSITSLRRDSIGYARDRTTRDSLTLDSLFHPRIYPYLENVYWIDSAGRWIATWSMKKANKTGLLPVSDRPYFQDYMRHNFLTLPGDPPDSFTIQPTLSKTDGDYIISIIMASRLTPRSAARPRLIGLSTKMYSVCNPLLPSGYSFSIIDDQGSILYDSKPGRALLSTIVKEADDPSDILEALRYHNERYFPNYLLRGQPRAVLVTPMKGFPYALLISYDLSGSDSFQAHLIGLSVFWGACVLLLLIISALTKERFEKRPGILKTPVHHFEWLLPTPVKHRYYAHLNGGMLLLLLLFIGIWASIEIAVPRYEFSLFYISLLFPFYLAFYYFLLREIQFKDPWGKLRPGRFILPNLQLILCLGLSIIAANIYACNGTGSPFTPLLIVQLVFITAIGLLLVCFQWRNRHAPDLKKRFFWKWLLGAQRLGVLKKHLPESWLSAYTAAIVIGIFLTTIVPAISIFWILFRQESLLTSGASQLELARSIDQRRTTVNQRIVEFKVDLHDSASSGDVQALHLLKFKYGIYLPEKDTLLATQPSFVPALTPIATEYTQLHRWFFRRDTTALAWANHPSFADDSSWEFIRGQGKSGSPRLLYNRQQDGVEDSAILLRANSDLGSDASHLMWRETWSASSFYTVFYFGGIVLIIFLIWTLTVALAKRIYLIDLIRNNFHKSDDTRDIDHPLDECGNGKKPASIDKVYYEETGPSINTDRYERQVANNARNLGDYYSCVWGKLSELEKFTLYDFATDGFTNYTNGATLTLLIRKHVLRIDDNNRCLEFVTPSFREWILQNHDDKDFARIIGQARKEGPWENFSKPLVILLAIPGILIFVTQEDIYQRAIGFLTAVGPLAQLVSSIFFQKDGDVDVTIADSTNIHNAAK